LCFRPGTAVKSLRRSRNVYATEHPGAGGNSSHCKAAGVSALTLDGTLCGIHA
jgi:hypothetical protein